MRFFQENIFLHNKQSKPLEGGKSKITIYFPGSFGEESIATIHSKFSRRSRRKIWRCPNRVVSSPDSRSPQLSFSAVGQRQASLSTGNSNFYPWDNAGEWGGAPRNGESPKFRVIYPRTKATSLSSPRFELQVSFRERERSKVKANFRIRAVVSDDSDYRERIRGSLPRALAGSASGG